MWDLKEVINNKVSWDVIANDKKSQLLIECKKQRSGCMSVRARGPMDFSAEDVWRTIHYCKMRPEWDVN